MTETTFDYVADRGLVHVRVVPDMGRLTAVITPGDKSAASAAIAAIPGSIPAIPGMKVPKAAATAIASAPISDNAISPALPSKPRAETLPNAPPPPGLPSDFGSPQFKAVERALGELLKLLVTTGSSDLHLRVGEPPIFRTHGEMKRQKGRRRSPVPGARDDGARPSCRSAIAASGTSAVTRTSPTRSPAWRASA